MEQPGSGILGRLGEKILGWIALGVLILIGVWIYWIGAAGRDELWNWIWRTALWLALVAAVPWTAKLFIQRILELSSNWAGAGVLAVFTALDVVVGALLVLRWPTGWWWLATLALVGVAGVYNYLVTEYVSEQAGG